MKTWVRNTLLVALALPVTGVTAGAGKAGQQDAPPNIIVILADDLGWGDLGCYGHPIIQTPNLDRLAAEGIRLTDCHAGAAICSPSRGALLTGRTPTRLGIYGLCNNGVHMRDEEITIPELLKQAGYATYFAGKWHLGELTGGAQPNPGDQGFDRWFAGSNGTPTTWRSEGFVEDGEPLAEPPDGYYCDVIVDKALSWLRERDPAKPFFLELCSSEPHEPVTPSPAYAARYDNERTGKLEPQVPRGGIPVPPWQLGRTDLSKHYYGIVTQLDNAVGTLLDGLDELGLAENTLIVFTSDNGPEYFHWVFKNRRTYGSTGGFRGGKRFLYEGGTRVPGIIRWPARIRPGQVSDEFVVNFDLLPTFCELAGVEPPRGRVLDGASIVPLFDGKGVQRTHPVFWHGARIDIPHFSMRLGDEVIIAYVEKPREGEQRGEWLRTAPVERIEYYDVAIDPYQQVEMSAERPERFRELRDEFLRGLEALRADMPVWANARTGKPVSSLLDWEKLPWSHQIRTEGPFDYPMRPDKTYPPVGH